MNRHDMKGRVCLVTGATSGHGEAMAHLLAARGADVVLLGRSEERCRAVQAAVAAENGGDEPAILLCDLASQKDVERAAADYRASGRPLHVLVNNAGLVSLSRQTSVDGFELCFAVNYLAAVRLTLRLLPSLRESAPARIVNISSDTYKLGGIDLDDLQLEKRYSMSAAYSNSKLAILHFTLELARRLEGTGITVNAVDPGPIASNIGANNPGLLYTLTRPMIRHLFPSAARAARTAMIVACDAPGGETTGAYFRSRKRRQKLGPEADTELRAALWRVTIELLGAEAARDVEMS